MQQRPSFDLAKLSTADAILLGAGVLYFVDLFLPWNRLCEQRPGGLCVSASGWSGVGTLSGVVVIVLIVWTALLAAGMALPDSLPSWTVSCGGAALILLLTIVRAAQRPAIRGFFGLPFPLSRFVFLWVGLILAILLALAGYLKLAEAQRES